MALTTPKEMRNLQLYAVLGDGVQPLPVPDETADFDSLYALLPGIALGVYSVLRTFDGHKFLDLTGHITRLRQSMTGLDWDPALLDEAALRRAIHEVCTSYPAPEARIRFDFLARPATALGTDSRLLLAIMPFTPPPPALYEQGVSLGVAQGLGRATPLLKTADFAQQRRTYSQQNNDNYYEYLLLDEAGRILEGTGSNFYAVRAGVVYTAESGILAGITRRIILDLLPQLGIPLRLEVVHIDDIGQLDEAAMSSSSRALLPVVAIEGKTVGNGRPGPISRRILAAYNEYVAGVVETAV
jgi:branched-chain amino acid aminotransferase